jgi:glycosyltransferase involved in cell wall biosynthesis
VPRGRRAGGPRVLVIVQNLPYEFDRRVRLECSALVRAGYRVSVICPKSITAPSFYVRDGVRVHSYRGAPLTRGLASYVVEFLYAWLRTALISLRIFVKEGFDVVQACNPPDTYWLLGLFYRLFGKRFVYDQHDLCPELYRSRFGRDTGVLLKTLYFLERCTYLVAHRVISTNDSYREIALTRGGKSPEHVTVVRSGPDPERTRRAEPRPELKHGRDHLAVYLGIMGPQDGVDYLVRAIGHYVHDLGHTDTHFALLGFGDALEDLKALTAELELQSWVTFTGRADEQMIRDYLSTADIGLSPDPSSPLNDLSTMNKTLEYMAFELPVVAFDLKETRISAGDAAVYIEDNDEFSYAKAVHELLQDPARRARMGALGRGRILESLAWVYQEAAYLRLYDQLFGRRAVVRLPRQVHTPMVDMRPLGTTAHSR